MATQAPSRFHIPAQCFQCDCSNYEGSYYLTIRNGGVEHPKGRLSSPLDSDQVKDKALGRMIYLRRFAAQSRVTIFEGGHEEHRRSRF